MYLYVGTVCIQRRQRAGVEYSIHSIQLPIDYGGRMYVTFSCAAKQ